MKIRDDSPEFATDYNTYKGRYLDSKIARMEVEQNMNALLNRVNLLEREEEKLLTKIDQTKVRATTIMEIKTHHFGSSGNLGLWFGSVGSLGFGPK